MHICKEYTVAYFIFYASCHFARTLRAKRRHNPGNWRGFFRRRKPAARAGGSDGRHLFSSGFIYHARAGAGHPAGSFPHRLTCCRQACETSPRRRGESPGVPIPLWPEPGISGDGGADLTLLGLTGDGIYAIFYLCARGNAPRKIQSDI